MIELTKMRAANLFKMNEKIEAKKHRLVDEQKKGGQSDWNLIVGTYAKVINEIGTYTQQDTQYVYVYLI